MGEPIDWDALDPDDIEHIRASGSVICEVCGLEYRKHPREPRVPGLDGHPFLVRLCTGELGHL